MSHLLSDYEAGLLAGLMFGLGFGMILGYYIL